MAPTPEHPHGFVARTLSTARGALAYLERRPASAAADAPTFVLIHGAGGSARSLALLAPSPGPADPLALIALELPGRGGSLELPACSDADAAAQLVVALLEALARPNAILVGHSLGGAIALATALRAPERVAGLAMVSSGSKLGVSPQIMSLVEALAAAETPAPFPLDFAFAPGTAPAIIEAYAEATRATPPAASLADWRACDSFDRRAELGSLRCPTLVLYGSADALTLPRFQAKLAAAIPGAEPVELEGIGHMLPWEAPERFWSELRRWAELRR